MGISLGGMIILMRAGVTRNDGGYPNWIHKGATRRVGVVRWGGGMPDAETFARPRRFVEVKSKRADSQAIFLAKGAFGTFNLTVTGWVEKCLGRLHAAASANNATSASRAFVYPIRIP